jgi:hypothetical protein
VNVGKKGHVADSREGVPERLGREPSGSAARECELWDLVGDSITAKSSLLEYLDTVVSVAVVLVKQKWLTAGVTYPDRSEDEWISTDQRNRPIDVDRDPTPLVPAMQAILGNPMV